MNDNTEALPPLDALFRENAIPMNDRNGALYDAISAALAQRQQVPAGFVLAPREATDDMVQAALIAGDEVQVKHLGRWKPSPRYCYEKMLMAAPAAPALTAAPSAQAEPHAPFLFVAMDDDKRAHLTWCADEAAVRDAVKSAMFFLQDGEELSPEHTEQLDGSVEELLDSGALVFEGDAPLYLYRVGSPAQPPEREAQQEGGVGNAALSGGPA